MKQGFSLVELSIVLVILGLLTGGILAGQSLIRASELRAVTTEYQRYIAAVNTFRDKYFALPGDFRDASKFWGRQVAAAHCITNSAAAVATPGACDGTGDGTLGNPAAAAESGEIFQFWKHLANAGLIEGSYTGLAGPGASIDGIISTNLPPSKLGNAGWTAYYAATQAGGVDWYAGPMNNLFYFGGKVTNSVTYNPSMKAEEVWNIDTKLDDGKPGSGKIITFWRTACTNSASATDYASGYKLDVTTTSCTPFFINAF